MADMTVSAFVSGIIKDKKFRDEVIAHIPAELMQDKDGEDSDGEMDLERFAATLNPAAAAMGYNFSEEELGQVFEKQVKALGGFAKIKFFVGFGKALIKRAKAMK